MNHWWIVTFTVEDSCSGTDNPDKPGITATIRISAPNLTAAVQMAQGVFIGGNTTPVSARLEQPPTTTE